MSTEWFVRSESLIYKSEIKNTHYIDKNTICCLIHLIVNRYQLNFGLKSILNYLFDGETFQTFCKRNISLIRNNNYFVTQFSDYYFSNDIETPPLFIFCVKQTLYYRKYKFCTFEVSLNNNNYLYQKESLRGFQYIENAIQKELSIKCPDVQYKSSLKNNRFKFYIKSDEKGYYRDKFISKNNNEYPKTKYIVDVFQNVDWISVILSPRYIFKKNGIYQCYWEIKKIKIIS